MQVLNALIVDEIRDQDNGTVDLIGLREDLFFDSLPVILERLTLFLELEIQAEDRGLKQSLLFRVTDPAGKALHETPVSFTIPPDFPRPVAPLDPTLFEIPFEQFGWHFLDIFTTAAHVRRLYINVLPREWAAFPEKDAA